MGFTLIWQPWTIAARNEPIPGNLRRIIKEKGMKQCAVAKKADMKAQELYDMLRGKRVIYARDIQTFATVLGVDMSELFRDSQHNPSDDDL